MARHALSNESSPAPPRRRPRYLPDTRYTATGVEGPTTGGSAKPKLGVVPPLARANPSAHPLPLSSTSTPLGTARASSESERTVWISSSIFRGTRWGAGARSLRLVRHEYRCWMPAGWSSCDTRKRLLKCAVVVANHCLKRRLARSEPRSLPR